MDLIFIAKVLVVIILVLLYILIAFLSRKLSAVNLMITNIVMILIFIAAGFLSFWLIDISLKKAKLIGGVKQSRNLAREQLIYYGTVKNVGHYTIDHVYVSVKVVNNVSGKKNTSLRGEGGGAKPPGSITDKCVAIKRLRKGETKSFSCRMPYPPSYRLADIKFKLSWD